MGSKTVEKDTIFIKNNDLSNNIVLYVNDCDDLFDELTENEINNRYNIRKRKARWCDD